ncbi:glycosyltransferase family 39 protein [Pseudovibrio axinellae]|nr:glycosyltransferase family 39 protein [Pseudovibrio axinellae]
MVFIERFREALLPFVVGGLSVILLAAIVFRILGEQPESNSYALLAEAFLQGRFDATRCFDLDCALFEEKIFVIFPPVPALIALPFVAIFGASFQHFIVLGTLCFTVTAVVWWQVSRVYQTDRQLAALLVLAFLFATPLQYSVLRADGIWFFAQAVAVMLTSLALWSALVKKNAWLVGLFIGLAFLSRQMSILYMPFFFVLMSSPDRSVFAINVESFRRFLKLAVFPACAILVYFAYNYARFGDPLQTGYAYIFPPEWEALRKPLTAWIEHRVQELGLFHRDYFLFNLVHFFVQGPDVEFSGRYLTQLSGFGDKGIALFIGAPFLFYFFLAQWSREYLFAVLTILLIAGLTLFYHSNGFSQYSVQRYTLDWLPLMMLFVVRTVRSVDKGIFALLVAQALFLSVVMQVLAFAVNV